MMLPWTWLYWGVGSCLVGTAFSTDGLQSPILAVLPKNNQLKMRSKIKSNFFHVINNSKQKSLLSQVWENQKHTLQKIKILWRRKRVPVFNINFNTEVCKSMSLQMWFLPPSSFWLKVLLKKIKLFVGFRICCTVMCTNTGNPAF